MNQWDANDQDFCREYEKPAPSQDEIGELDTSIEEWREALEIKDDEGQTISEISAATGVAESTVRRKLKKLIKEGKCIRGKAMRSYPEIDGGGGMHSGRWNVYHLIGEEK